MEKSKKALSEFAEESGTLIYGLSIVPDDWVNQLKTYHNIKLENDQIAVILITTMALYLELMVARIDDILTPEECETVEKNSEQKILHYFRLVNFRGQKKMEEKISAISNVLSGIVSDLRTDQKEQGTTIPQTYICSFIKTFGDVISEEILTEYVKSKIELFEEQNFRDRLNKKLEYYR